MKGVLYVAMLLFIAPLAGCAIATPNIKEIWDADIPADPETKRPSITGAAQIAFEIKKRVYCELKEAVQATSKIDIVESDSLTGKQRVKQKGLIPTSWGAQVTLSLQVDETISLNPGVSFNEVLPNAVRVFGVGKSVTVGQSTGLSIGGALSSTATRIDKINPYYSIANLAKPLHPDSICRGESKDPFVRAGLSTAKSSPLIVQSELGIKDWLMGAMILNSSLPSDAPPSGTGSGSQGGGGSGAQGGGPRPDTVSYQIKFVIISSGNITPTWKLIRFSANTGSVPFFGTGRTRTHDLIITVGPPTTATANRHLASEIGAAVNANRNVQGSQ
jgi:hypothetical protein